MSCPIGFFKLVDFPEQLAEFDLSNSSHFYSFFCSIGKEERIILPLLMNWEN